MGIYLELVFSKSRLERLGVLDYMWRFGGKFGISEFRFLRLECFFGVFGVKVG